MYISFYGDINEKTQNIIREVMQSEYGGMEWDVMTFGERQVMIKEEIINSLWAFNSNFILNHTNINWNEANWGLINEALQEMQEKLCESANELIKAMIKDLDNFVEDAIRSDGYGHFLSRYDGHEVEISVNNEYYYAYRQN